MAETKFIEKNVEEYDLKGVVISSNKEGQEDIAPVVTSLNYYESILDSTIRVNLSYIDTGTGSEKSESVLDSLPIVGTEQVDVTMEDSKEEKLELKMYINQVSPISESTQRNSVDLLMVSKEFFDNESGKTRVVQRFDGKISDHIKKILTGDTYLATDKDVSDIETTENRYNCWGRNLKPFAFTDWIQQKGIPSSTDASGTAGFFLWETSEGYHFKSVDKLMAQEPKKKYIYNNIPDEKGKNIPGDYDGQIIAFDSNSNINYQKKLELGTYDTRIILFNPLNCEYKIVEPKVKTESSGSSSSKEMNPELAAEELPVFNREFDKKFTRTTYMLVDTGTLPSGDTDAQIEKCEEPNNKPEDTLNQSKMRYNQMFTVRKSITIPADFTLHAGDAIFIDTPEVSDKKVQEINKQVGGLYIIVDLCHYMTAVPPACYTRLNIVRDSYGRKKK